MLIAHVLFTVEANNRQKALDALLAEARTVRAMQGCRTFLPFVDATNEAGLGVLHEWDSADAFAAYTSSACFAEVGKVLRPMMTGAPESRRFEAHLLERVD